MCIGYYYWNSILAFFGLKSKGEAKFDEFGTRKSNKCSTIIGDDHASHLRRTCQDKFNECEQAKTRLEKLPFGKASEIHRARNKLDKCMDEVEVMYKQSKTDNDNRMKEQKKEKGEMHKKIISMGYAGGLSKADMESVDDVCAYDTSKKGGILSQRMKNHAKAPLKRHLQTYQSAVYQIAEQKKRSLSARTKAWNFFLWVLDGILTLIRWPLRKIGITWGPVQNALTPSKWEIPYGHMLWDNPEVRKEVKDEIQGLINMGDKKMRYNNYHEKPHQTMAEVLDQVKAKKTLPSLDVQFPGWLTPWRKSKYYNELWSELVNNKTADKKGTGDLHHILYTPTNANGTPKYKGSYMDRNDNAFNKGTVCKMDGVLNRKSRDFSDDFKNKMNAIKEKMSVTHGAKKFYYADQTQQTCKDLAKGGLDNARKLLMGYKKKISVVGNDGTDSAAWDEYEKRLLKCKQDIDKHDVTKQ